MADVIGTELHFKPVFGDMARRDCHYAGIVDEQVDAWKRGGETGGAVCHRCQARQIEWFETYLGAGMRRTDIRERLLALFHIARCDNDAGTRPGKRLGRFISDTARRAGNDRNTARLVRYVLRHPVSHGSSLCGAARAELLL